MQKGEEDGLFKRDERVFFGGGAVFSTAPVGNEDKRYKPEDDSFHFPPKRVHARF